MKKYLFILFGLTFLGNSVFGQTKFRVAEKHYDKMRYASAIESYEEAFKFVSPTSEALLELADSYYKVGDMKNAERVYRSYISDSALVNPDLHASFQFAQTLAQNGKYEEAADWFEKYHKVKTLEKDNRGEDFHKAYRHNIHDFYKDSTLFDVFRLDVNSPQADFSPVFYGKGIVFTSGRKMENGVRRVHAWNNAAYLDMYYVDTNGVNERNYNTHIGEEHAAHKSYNYLNSNAKLHSDETYRTSNDSKTLGYHAHVFKGAPTANHSADPKPFSSTLNSRAHDGPCTFNKEQNMIVFTRNNRKGGVSRRSRDKVNKLALYIATKKDSSESWNKPEPFQFNNKEYSFAHPAFSPDGKTLYFASDMPGGFGGMDLFKSKLDGKKWGRPVNLGTEVNTEGNDVFPFVDQNNVLYFSSNGHPGLGGLDLFKFENNVVTHLNYPISSKKDDFGVVIWSDGRKGYLSSNRDLGGFDDDLYFFKASKSMLLKGKTFDAYTKKILKNTRMVLRDEKGNLLGETISDSLGEYSMPIEHEKVYKLKSSAKRYHDTTETIKTAGTRGQIIDKDVYLWNKIDVALLGVVTDRETNKALDNVHVRFEDPKTRLDFFDVRTGENGSFRNAVTEKRINDTIDIDIHLEKDKYLSKTVKFIAIVSDSGEIQLSQKLDLAMDKVKVGTDIGKILHLNPIYFDLSKFDIRPDAALELDKVVTIMQENPTLVIELGSHTDCRSSKKFNQDLSEKRAKASAAYIVSKGIESNRIVGKGYGESKLINNCACEDAKKSSCLEEEHQLNRRTEFLIVKM
ncbi:MAG: OmpA family protein [Opitutaceae bacterium]|nr:OmpA family protein [Cytophagales bacterium]